MAVVLNSVRQLLLWLQKHFINSECKLNGMFLQSIVYVYFYINSIGHEKELKSKLKIKVSLHKTFCESILLSADLEREHKGVTKHYPI
jgi:hypothetical protein